MGCTCILLGEIWQCICLFCGFVFLARWRYYSVLISKRVYFDCKTKLCLVVPGRHEKYIFTQASFNLQGILNDTFEYEQDTSGL